MERRQLIEVQPRAHIRLKSVELSLLQSMPQSKPRRRPPVRKSTMQRNTARIIYQLMLIVALAAIVFLRCVLTEHCPFGPIVFVIIQTSSFLGMKRMCHIVGQLDFLPLRPLLVQFISSEILHSENQHARLDAGLKGLPSELKNFAIPFVHVSTDITVLFVVAKLGSFC